jgi:hypothetical protein
VTKREYANSTDKEEFWKEFSFRGNRLEASGNESLGTGASNTARENRLDKSDTLNGNVTRNAFSIAENLEHDGVGSSLAGSQILSYA